MVTLLTVLWLFSLLILMGYHLFVFRSRNKHPKVHQWSALPGISIVIAVKNGSDHLIRNLGAFLSQDYPTFEIIIVDHSDPEEKNKLEEVVSNHPRVFHTFTPINLRVKNMRLPKVYRRQTMI